MGEQSRLGETGRVGWPDLPAEVRRQIEAVTGVPVVGSEDVGGGSSPGMLGRLRLADGETVVIKAVSTEWSQKAALHRTESRIAAALPPSVPTPRFRGSFDDGGWVGVLFEDVDGRPPAQPWSTPELVRALDMLTELAESLTPARAVLAWAVGSRPARLGGWGRIAASGEHALRLPEISPWAADHLGRLCELEGRGVSAAEGDSLVHFDLHPNNVLLSGDRGYVVDWAFARLGNPLVDLVTLLSSVAADGLDPDPFALAHPLAADVAPGVLDALIAAHAGFCLMSSLPASTPRRQPILAYKRKLGLGALAWLAARLD